MKEGGSAFEILDALPHSVIGLDKENRVTSLNQAAEILLQASRATVQGREISRYLPFASPILSLIDQARSSGSPVREYRLDVSSPRTGRDVIVDVDVAPASEGDGRIVLMLQRQSIAHKLDESHGRRGVARSITGLAGMLAHEIKNPLAGIRGAAQLLETNAVEDDRDLTRLITDETDRIVRIVDRMQVFSDDRPVPRTALNIHSVLEDVRRVVTNGFGSTIRVREEYDPSLPPVHGNRDQLMQVFINLTKNACEALQAEREPEIGLSTRYRAGLRLVRAGSGDRVALPLEVVVTDNGPGVPGDVAACMFDPFVTTKTTGSGLGLPLVAKIVADHGGLIEHEAQPGRTSFRVMLPVHHG